MNTVKLNAYAKLNLTLDIKGVKNGYHMLDSLVTTVNISDGVTLKKRNDGIVRVVMRGAGSSSVLPEENNAQKAGDAFTAAFQTRGADIFIHKNIPIGAGMGGSSADAAAVIAGMGMLYGVSDMGAMKTLADSLGSDTGYLLSGGLARLGGRGCEVELLPYRQMYFLILFPRAGIPTRECYAEFDLCGTPGARTERAAAELAAGNLHWAAKCFGNDLFEPAKKLLPAVEDAYLSLRAFSPLGVSMTGSGSAVFGCFESRELCEWAKSRYRGKCRAVTAKSVDPLNPKTKRNPFVLGAEEGRE